MSTNGPTSVLFPSADFIAFALSHCQSACCSMKLWPYVVASIPRKVKSNSIVDGTHITNHSFVLCLKCKDAVTEFAPRFVERFMLMRYDVLDAIVEVTLCSAVSAKARDAPFLPISIIFPLKRIERVYACLQL